MDEGLIHKVCSYCVLNELLHETSSMAVWERNMSLKEKDDCCCYDWCAWQFKGQENIREIIVRLILMVTERCRLFGFCIATLKHSWSRKDSLTVQPIFYWMSIISFYMQSLSSAWFDLVMHGWTSIALQVSVHKYAQYCSHLPSFAVVCRQSHRVIMKMPLLFSAVCIGSPLSSHILSRLLSTFGNKLLSLSHWKQVVWTTASFRAVVVTSAAVSSQ